MMKNILLVIGLFYSLAVFSQYSVTGKIIDAETGQPVEFGNVILYRDGTYLDATECDGSGVFRFGSVAKGAYDIEMRMIGYTTRKTNITVSGHSDLQTIVLTPASFEMEGVEVIARKQQVIYKLDKKLISARSDIIASGGGTVTDILSKVPSVRVDVDGNVSFRGSTGFIVRVNGKPSMFNAAQALQQIPADQIESIEIITTPSARDQTDGDAGIINIITRQEYGEGISGAVNVFGSTYESRGMDFTLSKQSGGHRFRFGGIYGQRFRDSDFEQEKTTVVAGNSVTSHSKGPRRGEYYVYMLQAGWQLVRKQTDYYIDMTGGYEGWSNKGDLNYSETVSKPDVGPVYHEYSSKDHYDLHETLIAASTGFNHKFGREGHTLKGYFYLKYGGNALEKFESDLYDEHQSRQQGHQAWEDEHRWTIDGRLDYVFPYCGSGRLESGYQYYSYLEDGDYRMEYWNPSTGRFDDRDDIYNTFYFQRGLNTVYLLVNQRAGKFVFQTGVRGEHTHQVLRSSKIWANRIRNRMEFFPSAHAGYYFSEATGITAAYSRRTNRPELFFMEPYITFRDYYTAEIGNPDIRPEYINSFELSFKTDLGEQTVQAALFHRNRKDKIERLRVPYETGITLDSMANVGNDYSSGFELGLNIRTGTVWSFTLNGDVYYYEVRNKLDLGGRNESSVNYRISLHNNLRIIKNTVVQLDGSLIGPTVRTQGRQNGFFYTDIGVRQLFWGGKLTAGLSFRNFLNTAKYKSNIDTDNLVSHTAILPDFPLITLNIGFTFNNYKQRTRGREGSDFFEGTNY